MKSHAGPVTAQTAFNDPVKDIQEKTGETVPLTNSDTRSEEEASACNTCCDWSITILSFIALLAGFILMWIYLPRMTPYYKRANEHLNGTVSHSPNYVGFGKRQNLVCNSSISIGTVLPTKKTFLQLLDFD